MDPFLKFAHTVGVMKPNKIKKDNLTHVTKLDAALDSPEYAAEEKIDGCRYKMIGCRFFSTENVEKTDNFPHLRDFFVKLGMLNLIVEGEVNYPGRTSQYCVSVTGADPENAISFQKKNGYIQYTLFDILRTPKGTWMVNYTSEERRHVLETFYNTFVKGTPLEPYINLVDRRTENKRLFLKGIIDSGREGIVLKKLDSLYVMNKNPMWQWMKIKQSDETDLIITGFEPPTKEYNATGSANLADWKYWIEEAGIRIPVTKHFANGWIGSVVLSAYVNGELTQICTCSGMSEVVRIDMTNHPEKYLNKVAKVTFMEKTTAGYPRHPAFKMLHEGKRPEECIWEYTK